MVFALLIAEVIVSDEAIPEDVDEVVPEEVDEIFPDEVDELSDAVPEEPRVIVVPVESGIDVEVVDPETVTGTAVEPDGPVEVLRVYEGDVIEEPEAETSVVPDEPVTVLNIDVSTLLVGRADDSSEASDDAALDIILENCEARDEDTAESVTVATTPDSSELSEDARLDRAFEAAAVTDAGTLVVALAMLETSERTEDSAEDTKLETSDMTDGRTDDSAAVPVAVGWAVTGHVLLHVVGPVRVSRAVPEGVEPVMLSSPADVDEAPVAPEIGTAVVPVPPSRVLRNPGRMPDADETVAVESGTPPAVSLPDEELVALLAVLAAKDAVAVPVPRIESAEVKSEMMPLIPPVAECVMPPVTVG